MSLSAGRLSINGADLTVVTVDFETYYDPDYTLTKKINMSEYVRDERFHPYGAGIKIGDAPTQWVEFENLDEALGSIDWDNTALLCHNTAFDGFILSEHWGIVPAFYLDTLSMSRAVHPPNVKHNLDTIARLHGLEGKVKKASLEDMKGVREPTREQLDGLGEYCIDDVEDTYKMLYILEPYLPDDEFELIDITLRMFCDPVLEADVELLTEFKDRLHADKAVAIMKLGVTPTQLRSNDKFAALLEAEGVEPPLKISPTTAMMTYAFAKTDPGFQFLLNQHADKRVRDLCAARLQFKSSIKETRAQRLITSVSQGTEKLPVLLNYSGAHTHRWSGGNKMNMQNLTRGSALRKAVQAPEGYVLVVVDLSQIEARMLAWLADHETLLEQFRNGDKIYELMGSKIFGIPVDEITDESVERFVGKVCILGLGYGMGYVKLHDTLSTGAMGKTVDLGLIICSRIVTTYRAEHYPIPKLWKRMDDILTNMVIGKDGTFKCLEYGKEYIKLPNGLFLQYPKLSGIEEGSFQGTFILGNVTYETSVKTGTKRTKLYGGLLTENIVQALSRVLIGEQMLKIARMGYRIVTTTHDEVVVCVEESRAQQCYNDMLRIMTTPPEWAPELPLDAKGGWDRSYSK